GAVVADGGMWKGTRLIPEPWIREMARPASPAAPEMGLVWHLIRDPATNEPIGYQHTGSQGQMLLIFPDAGLVIVRMLTLKGEGWGDEYEIGFPALFPLAERLAATRRS